MTWEVGLAEGDQTVDTSNVSRILGEVRNDPSSLHAEKSIWDGDCQSVFLEGYFSP